MTASRLVDVALVVSLVAALTAYAALALAVERWWISGLAALLVAVLLLRRHRRARFAAYVFLSLALARGLQSGVWPVAVGAVVVALILQSAPARRRWPRLTPRWRRASTSARCSSTMARP